MRILILLLLQIVLVCQSALAVLDNGQSYVWQGVVEDSPFEAYADTPYYLDIYPRAYYQSGYTFVAWQDVHRDPRLLRYTHSTRQIDFSSNTPTNDVMYNSQVDSHGNPALMVDGSGYVHIFFGCHFSPLLHYKSNSPYQINGWTQQSDVDSSATYPQLLKSGTNYVLSYRDANADWGYRTSSDNLSTFSAFNVVWDSTDTNHRFYAQVAYRTDGKLAFSATFCDVATAIRTNVYYVYLDGSTWKNAAGVAVTVPITKESADVECLAFDSNGDDIDLGRPVFDSLSNPYLKYKHATTSSYGIVYYSDGWRYWETSTYYFQGIKMVNDKVTALGRLTGETYNVSKFTDLLNSPENKRVIDSNVTVGSISNGAYVDNANDDVQWVFITKPTGSSNFYLYLYGQYGLIGQIQSKMSGTIKGTLR